jgi:hypothetical protein
MLYLLNRRLPDKISLSPALWRGMSGALAGGASAYLAAVYLPGNAILTALAGMLLGAAVAVPFIWTELRVLLRL